MDMYWTLDQKVIRAFKIQRLVRLILAFVFGTWGINVTIYQPPEKSYRIYSPLYKSLVKIVNIQTLNPSYCWWFRNPKQPGMYKTL